jgi:hypothetical protein
LRPSYLNKKIFIIITFNAAKKTSAFPARKQ